jgi:SAM-dependent methyltransferase
MLKTLRSAARALLGPVPPKPERDRGTSAPTLAPPLPAPAEEPFDSPCPSRPILKLDSCPVCGSAEATRVGRYNKFVLYDLIPDTAATIYSYSLCHDCGVVYATLRPAGERYDWLLEHFEETIGRTGLGDQRDGKLTLSSYALTDETREQLRRLASRGIFISDHSGISRKEFLPGLMVDRLANSVHVEILGSLLPLNRPRVLEIRSRLGGISGALKRLYDADCQALTLFENQQHLIQEVYGIPAKCPIDFDHFEIPFEGQFDLIVSKHMLTHAVRPREFLATVRSRLRPGGHFYIYSEFVEAEFLEQGHSMFNTLNPFHLQTFNTPSAVRALEANGFKMIFCTMHDGHLAGLAQRMEDIPADWQRMTHEERGRRRGQYRQAFDLAVLQVPEPLRSRVAQEWDGALERSLANGTAEIVKKGHVKVRPPKSGKLKRAPDH